MKEIEFTEVEVWVQIYDLPLEYYTKEVGKKLAKILGYFKAYDNQDIARKYMRLKVALKKKSPKAKHKT